MSRTWSELANDWLRRSQEKIFHASIPTHYGTSISAAVPSKTNDQVAFERLMAETCKKMAESEHGNEIQKWVSLNEKSEGAGWPGKDITADAVRMMKSESASNG